MSFLSIVLQTGEKVQIEGKRFAFDVQGEKFWFFVHRSANRHCSSVTHCDSGKRVLDITFPEIAACNNDEKEAAKYALDNFIKRIGEARVRSVLAGAKGVRA